MPTNIRDPRTLVTPDAFGIDEKLLGTPLASPWRRFWAMMIDLVAIGVLTVFLQSIQLFVWGVVALFFLRIALQRPGRVSHAAAVLMRVFVGCLGLTILVSVALAFLVFRGIGDDARLSVDGRALTEDVVDSIVREALRGAGARADTATEDTATAADTAITTTAEPDTLILGPAADTVRRLRAALERAQDSLEELGEERDDYREALAAVGREADRDNAFVELLRDIWDQAGSAIGLWSIYFTVLLTLWKGQTVGKKALGVRVLRLDGEPMTWWYAFERAGGYVAGIATGLLGFAQVFWDPNRQCIHDKIVGTVVVREGAPRIEGAWLETRNTRTTTRGKP